MNDNAAVQIAETKPAAEGRACFGIAGSLESITLQIDGLQIALRCIADSLSASETTHNAVYAIADALRDKVLALEEHYRGLNRPKGNA